MAPPPESSIPQSLLLALGLVSASTVTACVCLSKVNACLDYADSSSDVLDVDTDTDTDADTDTDTDADTDSDSDTAVTQETGDTGDTGGSTGATDPVGAQVIQRLIESGILPDDIQERLSGKLAD